MKRFLTTALATVLILTTFAFPVSAKETTNLTVSSNDESYDISDKLYGSFIEDISYACDGGLVSNLVNNDSFEYEYNNFTGWVADGFEAKCATENPINESNTAYAVITADKKATLTNIGYTEMYDYKSYDRDEKKASTSDMGFKEGVGYDFSCYFKNVDFVGTVSIYLNSPSNKNEKAKMDFSEPQNNWIKREATFQSKATEDGGLTIEFNGTGTIYLDFVTLTPNDSYGYGTDEWKYTTLRSDLFESLKNLSPKFIRFPGGCFAEGDSVDNLYSWKETIGPLEEREQGYNVWKDDNGRDYINTNAMGYNEFFQLCDDLGSEPLPILNAGLTCQGRCDYDTHVAAYEKLSMTDNEWTQFLIDERNFESDDESGMAEYTKTAESYNINSKGDWENYLDTIALRPDTAEFNSYVQDIIDLIEYANGDAQTTYWGAIRAANGQTEPYNLKYIGIGNENWGEIYERNFKAIYEAVKKASPDITIISSSGAWLEGTAFDENWSWINEGYADTIVDEHYYTGDGYLFDNNDRYDSYDRNNAHVFIGEYAATASGVGTLETKSNMLEAVEEASYLTGVERNGDVVEMASYAPTFAKVNAMSWNINLIWFDSQEIVLTPSYYVQMLYSNNYGTKYIKSTFDNKKTEKNGIYESVTNDEKSQVLYIKLVNTDGKKKNVGINLDGYDINKISVQSITSKYKSACNEIGKNTTYPTEYEIEKSKTFDVEMDSYDVSIVRVAYGENDGSALYALPDFISTQTNDTSNYLPPIVKIGVPCAVAGIVLIGAGVTAIVLIIKRKKGKGKTN